MPEYSGSGDPRRTMELLWGLSKAPTRGPKQSLDVERITRAAIDVADADGLEVLSMRGVAKALGVGTMSLYTYVPGKAELLDLMMDRVAVESLPAVSAAIGTGWRRALGTYAGESWALYHRHPWLLEISGTRASLGPHESDLFEAAHAGIAELDVGAEDKARIVNIVAGFVGGAARQATDAALAERRTGISDDDWWNARSPILDEVMTGERYPVLTALEAAGAFEQVGGSDPRYLVEEARRDFDFGLRRLLDGIGAFVAGGADQ